MTAIAAASTLASTLNRRLAACRAVWMPLLIAAVIAIAATSLARLTNPEMRSYPRSR